MAFKEGNGGGSYIVVELEAEGRRLVSGSGASDIRIFEMEGVSGLDFDFKSAGSPQSPNTFIYAKKPLPRSIVLRFTAEPSERIGLSGFFNPHARGRLTVSWCGVSRFIYYNPLPVRFVKGLSRGVLVCEAELICPEPYWLDTDDFGKNIADRQMLLAFPFVMRSGGVAADYKTYNQTVVINNRGEADAPLRVVFTALGDVSNPKLALAGGGFIRVLIDMRKGDVIDVSTDTDDLYVRHNGEDILHKTDSNMSFFSLPRGQCELSYSADEGTLNLNAYVHYRARFVGV